MALDLKKAAEKRALRCEDCGTPFCQWACPVGNCIPEWNRLVSRGEWKRAFELLDATNDMPEITGRVCPAPCESGCIVGINEEPVTIKENELAIIERAFEKGFIEPRPPHQRTGKRVAVIGSGPAGLSCAAQLNKSGHHVVVFERDEAIGGILRLGIPDPKLEKWIIDRRVGVWGREGIEFRTSVDVGTGYPTSKILKEFNALCIACGSRVPRDLQIEGRSLRGIYFAMDYLTQANRRRTGQEVAKSDLIDANGKKVVVIGGGDTGSDCVHTAKDQGAARVTQIEILPRPTKHPAHTLHWRNYTGATALSDHEEGVVRRWCILTKKFTGQNGCVAKLSCKQVEFAGGEKKGGPSMQEVPESEFEIEADLVLLAIGFVHAEHNGLLSSLGIELDPRGNVKTDDGYSTSREGIFSAGDMRTGQSLIVQALYDGRMCAQGMDAYLTRRSPAPGL